MNDRRESPRASVKRFRQSTIQEFADKPTGKKLKMLGPDTPVVANIKEIDPSDPEVSPVKSNKYDETKKDATESQDCITINDSDSDAGSDAPQPSTSTESAPKLKKQPSLGADVETLKRTPECWKASFHDLKPSSSHTVLFQASTLSTSKPPLPYPKEFRDSWDQDHVRMPCSRKSEYPMRNGKGEERVEKRWHLIEAALCKDEFSSAEDISEAIMSYNGKQRWKLRGLRKYFSEIPKAEGAAILSKVLPAMARLALRLPQLCTAPIPLLKKGMKHAVTLSQEQAACLLANAFFCTFPRRNSRNPNAEYSNYNDINFSSILNGTSSKSMEKLKCLLHYFKRVTEDMPCGTLTFQRKGFDGFPSWHHSKKLFRKLHVSQKGTIEDNGIGMLQVDFANKYLGGGTLGQGCVQEEIRFLICPEMILSMLLTEALAQNESLLMTGCERFSFYSGYASTFEWRESYVDTTDRDEWKRIQCEVVAIDAIYFSKPRLQYSPSCVIRELNKAYVGFYEKDRKADSLPAVATGNWGCGAFNGDVQLKSLIQLMACAECDRDVAYFTFNDEKLMLSIHKMHTELVKRSISVGQVTLMLENYYKTHVYEKQLREVYLFDYIHEVFAGAGVPDLDQIQDTVKQAEQTISDNQPHSNESINQEIEENTIDELIEA